MSLFFLVLYGQELIYTNCIVASKMLKQEEVTEELSLWDLTIVPLNSKLQSLTYGQGSVYVCVSSQWGHVWGGSYDEETFSFWDSVFYEGSKIWKRIEGELRNFNPFSYV